MRNRVREFQVTEPMPDGSLVDVVSCASCMCRWIVEGCSAVDGAAVIQPMLQEPMAVSADIADIGCQIDGLNALFVAARLPAPVCQAIEAELSELGAVTTAELTMEDWKALNSFALMRPLQQRRVLQQTTGR